MVLCHWILPPAKGVCGVPVFHLNEAKQDPPPQDCFLAFSLPDFWRGRSSFNFLHFKPCKAIAERRGMLIGWNEDTSTGLVKDYFRIAPTLRRDFQGVLSVWTWNASCFSELTLKSESKTIKLYLMILAIIITATSITDTSNSRNFWHWTWQSNSKETHTPSF